MAAINSQTNGFVSLGLRFIWHSLEKTGDGREGEQEIPPAHQRTPTPSRRCRFRTPGTLRCSAATNSERIYPNVLGSIPSVWSRRFRAAN